MKKLNIAVVKVFLILGILSGVQTSTMAEDQSTYTKVWTKQYGTPNGDYANSAVVDSSGNIYITGYSVGSLDGNSNAGGGDIFLTKFNSDGTKLWTKQYGSAAYDIGSSVVIDNSENIYIAGTTHGSLDGNTNLGGDDIFLTKFSGDGTKLWTKQYGSSSFDMGRSAIIDSNGNIYLAGKTVGSLDGNSNAGESDIFLTKFSGDGTKLWTKQYGSSSLDYVSSVTIDSSDNIYVAGYTSGSLDGNSNAGGGDIFLTKFNSDGIKLWTKQYGSDTSDNATTVTIDGSGNIYVAGYTHGSLDGNTNSGEEDIFLTKFNSDGTKIWTGEYGTSHDDRAFSVTTDSAGYVYLTGYLDGYGRGYVHLTKFSSDGIKIWTEQYGTSFSNLATSVTIDSSDNIYVSGYTNDSFDENTNAGSYDIFLTKFISDNTTGSAFIPIKKTGQTTSYADYDDGYYQKGAMPSYDRNNTTEIVTDNVTGLEWQDTAEVATVERTWQESVDYCAALPLDGGGWRLPNIMELVTILDYGESYPVLPDGVFQNDSNDIYWSTSVSSLYIDSQVWILPYGEGDFTIGGNLHIGEGESFNARCVRGEQVSTSHNVDRNNTTEIVTDRTTGLQWQDEEIVKTTTRTWNDAIGYCESLPLDGGGWRLPNMKELLTILDISRHGPALDTAVFQNYTLDSQYWSSTTLAEITDWPESTEWAWYVSFYEEGQPYYTEKIEDWIYVRCVRGEQVDLPIVTPPVIEASGDPDAEYKFSVTLEEPLPDGYYVAVNFDDEQGDWFTQADPGGHIVLSNLSGTTYWLNRTLYKPGLRSFRAGIFDANGNLIGEYSDFTTCTLDLCLQEVIQFDNYGNPELSRSGSQLIRGVDLVNGNLHYSTSDMSIPGKGPDFTLIRAYNSNADSWSFNIDASVSFVPDTFNRQVSVGPREDGRKQYYFKDMDQKWYALSPGNFDKLIEGSDGSFTLYTKGNLYYRFAVPTSSVTGRLLSINDRDGNALTFTHTSNLITGATDASSRNYTIVRDANGHITKVTDFTERFVEYTYNSDDMITNYKNSNGLNTTYTFNGTKLFTIIDPRENTQVTFTYYASGTYLDYVRYATDGESNQYEYLYTSIGTVVKRPTTNGKNNNLGFITDDNRTKIIERIDAQNVGDYRTKMTYRTTDKRQRIAEFSLVEETERPSGAKTNVTYVDDGTGNPDIIKDAINRETNANWTTLTDQTNLTPLSTLKKPGVAQATQYNNFTVSGKATQIVNALNQTTLQAYDVEGKLTQVTDARSNATNIAYDTQGRPTQVTDALGHVINTSYDSLGRVTSQSNARGFSTSYTYDNNGNMLTATDANNGVTTYTYDASDNVISIKDPRNNTVTYTYDILNRKITANYTVGATQYTRRTEYDAMGRVHKVIDESSNVNESQFDERGQVIASINPLLQSATYTYDANGNLLTVTDAESRTVANEYDSLDRVIKVTDPLNFFEEFAYDLRGLLIAKCDKKLRWTYYEYNDLGQMTKVIQPDGAFTQATYDANGNIATTTDRKNQTVTYTYNAINQMTEQEDAMGRKWKFTYDANGNMLTRTLPSNKVTGYTYDNLDRVTQVQYHDGQTVNYTYDANGNRLSMQDAQGTTNYIYDELNRLTQVTDNFGNSIGYTFHPVGTLKELIYPDNKKVTYSYDNAGRLSSLNDWLGDETSYSRDDSGLTKLITYGNGTTVEKDYDASGRLTSLFNKTGASTISSHSLTLDPVGNPTSIAADIPLLPGNLGKAAEMLYDSSNRLTSIDSKSITHDTDGRIMLDETNADPIQYAYNAQDLITSVINNSVTTDQYTYDGDGKRIARTTGGETTRYVLDPMGGDLYSLLVETNSANQIQYYYIYGEGLVSQVSGTNHKYYHFDQSGNTLALTNDGGTVTDKYAYEPFGNTTTDGTSHNPFRFVGAYGVMEDGNGLHHMRARYYKADMRRFMSLDALYGQVTDPMALNRYQYVSGNPMVGVDPSGYLTDNSYSSLGDNGTSWHNAYVYDFTSGQNISLSQLDVGWGTDTRSDGQSTSIYGGYYRLQEYKTSIFTDNLNANMNVSTVIAGEKCTRGYDEKENYVTSCIAGLEASAIDGGINMNLRYFELEAGGGAGVGGTLGLEHTENKEGYSEAIKFSASGKFLLGLSGGVQINHGQMLRDTNQVIIYTLDAYQSETLSLDMINALNRTTNQYLPSFLEIPEFTQN